VDEAISWGISLIAVFIVWLVWRSYSSDEQAQELEATLDELETILKEQQATISDLESQNNEQQNLLQEQENKMNELNDLYEKQETSSVMRLILTGLSSLAVGLLIGLLL
jgi:uncharacterized coiled-coil protein SlyX